MISSATGRGNQLPNGTSATHRIGRLEPTQHSHQEKLGTNTHSERPRRARVGRHPRRPRRAPHPLQIPADATQASPIRQRLPLPPREHQSSRRHRSGSLCFKRVHPPCIAWSCRRVTFHHFTVLPVPGTNAVRVLMVSRHGGKTDVQGYGDRLPADDNDDPRDLGVEQLTDICGLLESTRSRPRHTFPIRPVC